MERLVWGLGVRVLAVGLALFLCAGVASADSIMGGDLFGVFSNRESGTFSRTADPTEFYTVVHFIQFAPTPPSEFPGNLAPLAFPAAFIPEDFGFRPDAEFFFLGSLTGMDPDPNHLLLSNRSGTAPEVSVPLGSELHDSLVAGAMSLGSEVAIYEISAEAFWALFPDDVLGMSAEEAFFNLNVGFGQGPVVQLSDYNFQGGSEDLFGFTPKNYVGAVVGGVGDFYWTDQDGDATYPIPEPSTLALMFGALALGYGIHRRRRAA